MPKKELKRTRKDMIGVTTVVFTEDGKTIVTDSTGRGTYLFKEFPRTEEGLEKALDFFDAVQEMTAQSELAVEFEANRVTIH